LKEEDRKDEVTKGDEGGEVVRRIERKEGEMQ
jgi:hypothetical protein